MRLQNIYEKPIDRPIEGVIKADDDSGLILEVEEYVLTNEVAQRLSGFLDAYNNYNSANGVWISGFFGSGKSHLLKILSLLLEDREINDKSALDLFTPKCEDELLKAEIKKAATIPSQSILFNIDQKADVISKTEIDALLSVFVKVFDETCGYYGKQGHIAQFERDLDTRDQYQAFKESFQKYSNKTWEEGREQAILEAANIAKAYTDVMSGDIADYKDILGKYRSEYKVSIEDFAAQVWGFIQSKEKNFRLNFFVDEVGQYIAGNIKLMTNLQTIAESLATKCNGQAWIIVTAQQDVDNVVGEMDKQQANDFSKIQARFSNRMNLSSKNVDEVIQKRLLSKTSEASSDLEAIYTKHSNDFKTLFDFVDGSRNYKNFTDKEHFVISYPFIPYQFELFQGAIENLSAHNAFEGRHSSVGERSMLGVFQHVAIEIGDVDLGALATFDLMFEGIRNTLKAQIQRSIFNAEKNLSNEFAVKVLKALFLVKYVKEFKPTIHNICILMQRSIECDLPELKKDVEEALNLLEQQTYIQRNAQYYEFLTDEEKDIEKEIKNTEVDPGAETGELTSIIFDTVLKEPKIRHDQNGQYYKFARKLDDSLHGNRDYELTIHIISPFDERAGNENLLRSHNMGRNELMVIMDSDRRLLDDISMYLRTEKYIRQNTTRAQQESVSRILHEKAEQNKQRKQDVIQTVRHLLESARLIVSGTYITSGSADPQTRIMQGFQELITITYPQLKMLRNLTYKEDEIGKYLNPEDSLFDTDTAVLDEAEQEVLSYITSQGRVGVRTTLKSVIENFEKKPYGWYLAAIQCTIAKLNTRGKIECQMDSNILEGTELERGIRNTHAHSNIVLKPQQEFSAAQLRGLKEFFEDFFNVPPSANDAKALGMETLEHFKEKHNELGIFAAQRHEYPFLKVLDGAIEKLKSYSEKPYSFYIQELSGFEDELLNIRESVIQPIESFMSGDKKSIYSSAREFLRNHEHDFGYIDGKDSIALREILESDDCYKGEKIRAAKELHASLKKKLEAKLNALRAAKKEEIDTLKSKIETMDKYQGLSEPEREPFISSFDQARTHLDAVSSIPVLESDYGRFESSTYVGLLSKLESFGAKDDNKEDNTPKTEIVPVTKVRVSYSKALLGTADDVDEYIGEYKEALMNEINSGKKVQV